MRRESIILLSIILTLVMIGVFIVYSASAVEAHSVNRLTRQLIYVALGMAALFLGAHFDYHGFRAPVMFRAIVAFSISLLVFVLIPGIGDVRNGAQRWIELLGFSFQPSEIAKFALILLLAVKLSENQDQIRSFWKGFAPPILITGLFAGLVVLEKDLGTPVMMCATALSMLFLAGSPLRFVTMSVGLAGAGIYALSVTSEYRLRRFTAFLDPWSYSDTEGYQLIQSMAAFVQGDLWGRGPGASEQKLSYLPEAHTDFIFAIWAEEMGLVGSLAMVGLFVALLVVGLRIAFCARDFFGALLAGGIVSLITVQAGVNMAVTIGLLPTKGLPLPFISWGGSSLIMFLFMSGVLINVGLQAVEPQRSRPRARTA